ncbi:MAG TPA: LPXTG cell wall anchor domain-containing protein [Candidatus Acidoferrales bacterium]|nr:LPXTG cell wall anchor domain-containing protein [Candidatus Acidoferrales bacterium]
MTEVSTGDPALLIVLGLAVVVGVAVVVLRRRRN